MNSFQANLFLVPIGIGSVILFSLSAFKNGTYSPFTDNQTHEQSIFYFLWFSYSYFVIDFVLMLVRYKPENKIYFVHHSIGLISIPLVSFAFYGMIKYLLAYLTYELSTPFLNVCISNHKAGIKTDHAKTMELTFFIMFTLVRIIFGTYLLINVVPIFYHFENIFIRCLVIMPLILQGMNYWWYWRIIQIMAKNFLNDKTHDHKIE